MLTDDKKGKILSTDESGGYEVEFQRKLDAFFTKNIANNTKFVSPAGSLQGTFSVAVYSFSGRKIIRWFVGALADEGVEDQFRLPKSENEEADHYVHLAERFFSDKGFTPKQNLTQETLNSIVTARVDKLVTAHQKEFKLPDEATLRANRVPAGTRGTFTATLINPTHRDRYESIALKLSFRPISDYLSYKESYILRPHYIDISLQTTDIEQARNSLSQVKSLIEKSGFLEYDLSKTAKANPERKIPLEWLNKSQISIKRGVNQGAYHLELVDSKDRKPQIKISLHTASEAQAQEMKRVVIEELLPKFEEGGELHNTPLTITSIQTLLHERYPTATPAHKPRLPADVRQISVGEDCKLQTYTPQLNMITRPDGALHTTFVLRFAPPPKQGGNKATSTTITGSLNTADQKLAEQRLVTLRNLSEIAAKQYFTEHPDLQLPVKYEERVIGSKRLQSPIFRNPAPGETEKPNELFFDTLADTVIKPVLSDFERYISWDTEIKPGDGGKTQVAFKAVRNDGEAFAPETALFSGPFTVEFPDEKRAKNFARDLTMEMTKKQYFFGKERPVERFGETSQNLAVRESLRGIIQEYQSDIDLLGNNLLAQLMRERIRTP